MAKAEKEKAKKATPEAKGAKRGREADAEGAKGGAEGAKERRKADATDAKERKSTKSKASAPAKAQRTSAPAAPAAPPMRRTAAAAAPAARRTSGAAAASADLSVAELARQCHARVAGFAFDDPTAPAPAGTFLQRHAGDCELSAAEAATHAAEYLKFMALKAALLLAAPADATAGVTPPLAVDWVWHTHLLYSRSYLRMCSALLGASGTTNAVMIHHDPSPGGAAAGALYAAQYASAAALYRDAFGAAPPQRVWTAAEHRFSPLEQMVGITRGDRFTARFVMASMEEQEREAARDGGYDSMGCG
jgi:hypothetical protein